MLVLDVKRSRLVQIAAANALRSGPFEVLDRNLWK